MREKSLEELIIEMKNSYKKKTCGSIYTGVYIKEILYEFEEVELFDGKASIMLPLVFKDMPTTVAKIKYPNRNRPQIIKTNHDGSINCCFSILEQKISREEILSFTEEMRKALLAFQPQNECSNIYKSENDNATFGWFTYKNYSIDSIFFNHMFITEIKGAVLQGMFNCPYQDMELWKYVMKDMMLTLKDRTKL